MSKIFSLLVSSLLIITTTRNSSEAASPSLPAGPTLAVVQLLSSEIKYKVEYPLKTAVGTSKSTKGKGNCDQVTCKFLLAVAVNTFDSGDSNRDLHMLEVTRGASFPMIIVHTSVPNFLKDKPVTIPANLEIEFAGKKHTYTVENLALAYKGPQIEISGVIPLRLSDFNIERPSLLTIPIKNEVPITLLSSWEIRPDQSPN